MLTTTQAQKRAGVSRPTLSRALKSGELRGIRDNSGRWLIEPDDLDAWSRDRSRVHEERVLNAVQERQESKDFERLNAEIQALREGLAAAREALARAEGEGAANKARIEDLTADRDALRDALSRAAASQAEIVRPVDRERGGVAGLWARLRGRG